MFFGGFEGSVFSSEYSALSAQQNVLSIQYILFSF